MRQFRSQVGLLYHAAVRVFLLGGLVGIGLWQTGAVRADVLVAELSRDLAAIPWVVRRGPWGVGDRTVAGLRKASGGLVGRARRVTAPHRELATRVDQFLFARLMRAR